MRRHLEQMQKAREEGSRLHGKVVNGPIQAGIVYLPGPPNSPADNTVTYHYEGYMFGRFWDRSENNNIPIVYMWLI